MKSSTTPEAKSPFFLINNYYHKTRTLINKVDLRKDSNLKFKKNNKTMERLTAQEESVMLYIWKLGSCFIRDILNEMPDPKPPYTSVASVVRNLEKKKYVTPKKFGTITLFSPRVKEAEYKRTFMSNVVQNYFTGSYKEMVSFFVRDRKLSKSDLQDLMDQIEKEE